MKDSQTVTVEAAVVVGAEALPVVVAVDSSPEARGLGLQLIGWGEVAAREISVRVRSALAACKVDLSGTALRVRLVAEGLPEEWVTGGELDLAVAVAIAAELGRVPRESAKRFALVGELALDGTVRPVRGACLLAEAGRLRGAVAVVAAGESMREIEEFGGIRKEIGTHLSEVLDLLSRDEPQGLVDSLGEIAGTEERRKAWRNVRDAVDGGARCVLLTGPIGCAAHSIVRALRDRLPCPTPEERREILAVQSAAGLARGDGWTARPFRAPHHTVSVAGLVGGGFKPRPGEVSLAHRGVLFLDGLQDFARGSLDVLWETLQSKRAANFYRRGAGVTIPADPRLVIGFVAPCPCGWGGGRGCRCTVDQLVRYRDRGFGRFGELFELVVRLPGREG